MLPLYIFLSGLVLLLHGPARTHAFYTPTYRRNSTLGVREPYDPQITSPNASTTWLAGSTAEVTWDLSDMPSSAAGSTGSIVLGYLTDDGSDEHLDLDKPLATGFNITDGHMEVEVPYVPYSDDYIIVLFGDSGNRSPAFTIE